MFLISAETVPLWGKPRGEEVPLESGQTCRCQTRESSTMDVAVNLHLKDGCVSRGTKEVEGNAR